MKKLKTFGPYIAMGLMLLVVVGYSLGKSMAERDNARAAETETETATEG